MIHYDIRFKASCGCPMEEKMSELIFSSIGHPHWSRCHFIGTPSFAGALKRYGTKTLRKINPVYPVNKIHLRVRLCGENYSPFQEQHQATCFTGGI